MKQRNSGHLPRCAEANSWTAAMFSGFRLVRERLALDAAAKTLLLLVIITAAFVRVVYSADIPTGLSLLQFIVALLVGAAAFCALGLAATSVIPNSDAAAPIINAIILPLEFLSGIFIPFGSKTPAWILWVAKIFPVRHFVLSMQAAFVGTAFNWTDVLVVAVWGIAGLLLAIRFFTWEPRQG